MKFIALATAIVLVQPLAANAAAFSETTDAGSTIASATLASSGTTSIQGSLGSGDADIFGFNWNGGSFYVNTSTTSWDTQLFLFDSTGHGLYANDDGSSNGFALGSYIEASLSAGLYYLAITGWDNDPLNSLGQLIFPTNPFGPIYQPSVSDTQLASWSDATTSNGNYELIFRSSTGQQVETGGNTVPEPGALALLGLGAACMGYARRRKVKA